MVSNRGHTYFDVTKLTDKVPNKSWYYSYFAPKRRVEPETPTFPDIFEADCRISVGHKPVMEEGKQTDNASGLSRKSDDDSRILQSTHAESAGSFGPQADISQDSDDDVYVNMDEDSQQSSSELQASRTSDELMHELDVMEDDSVEDDDDDDDEEENSDESVSEQTIRIPKYLQH